MSHRHLWVVFCLATMLIAGQSLADDQAKRARIAENKAEALEQAVVQGDDPLPPSAEPITKPGVQAVDPNGEAPLDDAITCLSRAIYWEARGLGTEDMAAVANVVMNRLADEEFPDTVCAVVRQGGEQRPCQFSWWCDGRADVAENEEVYADAKEIARRALNRQLTDRTSGALYFHNRRLSPSWAAKFIKTAEIGKHVFYKPRK